MTNSRHKPKVAFHSLQILCDIDRYIRQYNVKGERLPEAASDVLDGAVFRREVDDLIRRGLLRVVRDGARWGEDPGGGYTLHLTERAVAIFWPDRAKVCA